jgi:hypothetical protein
LPRRPYSTRRIFGQGPLGGLAAGVGNVIVLVVGGMAGVDWHGSYAGPGSQWTTLAVGAVFVASFVPSVPATLVFAVLNRLTDRAAILFSALAALLALASLAGPAFLENATLGTRLGLLVMHAVAAATITASLTLFGRRS